MSKIKAFLLAAAVVAVPMLAVPSNADAGPLLDWLRGRRGCFSRNNDCNSCNTAAVPNYNYAETAASAPNAYGLQPGQCAKTCQQTCSRTVVNYVPYTAYRTNWNKVPVTQYKPVTNSDPCTGCSVTCMRPCTTYTYQMQRVPYTTYRPVYRTESYKVPVTTITNDCANGGCSTGTCGTVNPGCSTCGTSVPNQAPVFDPTPAANYAPTVNYAPYSSSTSQYTPNETVTGTYYEYPSGARAPSGTISTEGTYSSGQPADIAPSLQNINPQGSHRPVLDRMRNQPGQPNWTTNRQANYPKAAPTVVNYQNKTAMSPVRKDWNYSPIRLASYSSDTDVRGVQNDRRSINPETTFTPIKRSAQSNSLNGWTEVE